MLLLRVRPETCSTFRVLSGEILQILSLASLGILGCYFQTRKIQLCCLKMLSLIFVPLILNSITVLASEVNMASNIVGTYKLEKSENFDAFMEALGVGYLKRKAAGEF